MKVNQNQNQTPANGKCFARVVFFMAQNPYTNRWDPLAYFPDIPWDGDSKNMTSYMHEGQHSPCCDAFLFENCKAPSPRDRKAVERLKSELWDVGYVLTEVDTKEWLKGKAKRRAEVKDAIYQLCYKKDSEQMLAANAANGENRKMRKSA